MIPVHYNIHTIICMCIYIYTHISVHVIGVCVYICTDIYTHTPITCTL